MTRSFLCPHCQREVWVGDELAGKRLSCRHCNGVFVAPQPETPKAIVVENQPEESGLDFLSSVSPSSSSPRHYSPVRPKKSPVGRYISVGVVALAVIGGVIAFSVMQYDKATQKQRDDDGRAMIQRLDKETAESQKRIDKAKQQIAAMKTIKQDRENYGKILSSEDGWGSTMDKVTAMFGNTDDWHKASVGSSSFMDATWRNELRTITITFKYFSAKERGEGEGAFCVVIKAWYNN